MRCVVTGGAGFIGSHLADFLVQEGHDVVIVDNLMLGKRENINPQATFIESDIRDFAALSEAFVGADYVFHLAADPRLPVSIENPLLTHEINVTGTLNVLEAARKQGVKKVMFSSSCAVYGDQAVPIAETAVPAPLSPYGLQKLLGEYYCRLYSQLFKLPTVSLRYFNVFGPRKTADGGYPMVIPIFLAQKKSGQTLTIVGDGKQTRDYVQVQDVVRANWLAAQSPSASGEIFNIGSGVQTSVLDIAEMVGGQQSFVPQREGEMRFIEADTNKAKQVLGWQATISVAEGLRELMN